jgi:antitoxin Phd
MRRDAMKRLQFDDARRRLLELIHWARHDGPQMITLHGRDAVVVLSMQTYRRLMHSKGSLADFVRTSTLVGAALELNRSGEDGHRNRVRRSRPA